MNMAWGKVMLFLCGLAVAAVLLAAVFRPREPVYHGKPLHYWVNGTLDLHDDRFARRAIRKIGPNAIPFFVSAAGREDSTLRCFYRAAWPFVPKALQRKL